MPPQGLKQRLQPADLEVLTGRVAYQPVAKITCPVLAVNRNDSHPIGRESSSIFFPHFIVTLCPKSSECPKIFGTVIVSKP